MQTWTLRREKQINRDEWQKLERFLRDAAVLAEQRGGRRAIRNYAIVSLAAYTGLRRQEIADLNFSDVCLGNERAFLVVRCGKGKRAREVLISRHLRALLRKFARWKVEWKEPSEPESPWFASQRGRYSGSGIARVFRAACRRAGVRVLNVHALRHLCGSELLAATKDLNFVRTQLGHARLATTQVYLHLADEDAHENLKTFDELMATGRLPARTSDGRKRAIRIAR